VDARPSASSGSTAQGSPGFRTGKVPATVVQQFGAEIEREVLTGWCPVLKQALGEPPDPLLPPVSTTSLKSGERWCSWRR
jgi:hypothetical protein